MGTGCLRGDARGIGKFAGLFAIAHGGAGGLRIAMLSAGFVQVAGAAVAWREARPVEPSG
jgi:hypothetical protein